MFYADSSFLASLYLNDTNTAVANAFLAEAQKPLYFTVFNRVELRNALRNMVARREASSEAVSKAFRLIENDVSDGLLIEKKLDTIKLFKVAEQLSAKYAENAVIRCVDLLHVASAQTLGIRVFLTFDSQQSKFARLTGLEVKP